MNNQNQSSTLTMASGHGLGRGDVIVTRQVIRDHRWWVRALQALRLRGPSYRITRLRISAASGSTVHVKQPGA